MKNERQTLVSQVASSQLHSTASESAYLCQPKIKLYLANKNDTNRVPIRPNQEQAVRKLYLITARIRE
ncbi:hypothetical protein [Alteromonas macleodii]|uniref:hypothetical protein n=1 Tax=Alteromonas macleodii TaxID=28108 RepID=UPI0008596725|nr:hypothetical protein [Alteromonas macleodii]OES25806.1 hypothetical protein BFV93_4269 [Alteromonas macleodii]